MIKVVWIVNAEFPDSAIHNGRPINTGFGSWMKTLISYFQTSESINITVVYGDYSIKRKESFTSNGVDYVNIPFSRLDKHLFKNKANILELVNILNTINPDVIHIFGTERFFGLITPFVTAPVVVRIQAIIKSVLPYQQTNMPLLFFIRYPKYLLNILTLINKSRIEKKILDLNHFYEGQTDYDISWIKYLGSLQKYYRNNPILRNSFYSLTWNIESIDRNSILVIAYNYSHKGFHTLLYSFHSLKEKFPNATLNIVGNFHNNGYLGFCNKLIDKLNIHDRVNIKGYLSEIELAKAFMQSHIYVNPSFIENESLSMLESMAVGTPAIVSYAGGMHENLKHGYNGLTFPLGDPAQLAFYIDKIFSDDKLAAELSNNARTYIRKTIITEEVIKKTVSMYQELSLI